MGGKEGDTERAVRLFAATTARGLRMLLLLAPDALLVRGLPPRLPTVRSRHPNMCSDREEGPTEQRSLLERFTAFADASWDLFVMPGEYANSRYDRVIPPMNASELKPGPGPGPGPQRSAFNWGGDSKEEEALRLPTGIPAAERLAAERGPLPKKRAVSQAWLAVPSLIWLLSFGSFILGQQPSDPAVSDPSRTPGVTESRAERRVTQAEWMRARIAQREAEAAMATSQP